MSCNRILGSSKGRRRQQETEPHSGGEFSLQRLQPVSPAVQTNERELGAALSTFPQPKSPSISAPPRETSQLRE